MLVDACVRAAAADAAKRGWYVFPVAPGLKTPRRGCEWPQAATRDWAVVSDGANWRPGENYGVAAKPSGLVIVDLDVPKPGKPMPADWAAIPGVVDGSDVLAVLCERHGQQWPVTYWVRTPSGGQHLYFRALTGRPMPCSQGNARTGLGPMIDIKAAGGDGGGYVIGPGSFIGGGKYEVVHDQEPEPFPVWLADLLDPPGRPVSDRPRQDVPVPQGDLYGRMRGVIDRLANARPGDGRNSLLHWSACRFAEMVGDGEIDPASAESALYLAAEANGHVAKHGERATRATIASGMRRAAA